MKRHTTPRTITTLGLGLLGILLFAACGFSAGMEPAPDFLFSLYQGEEDLGAKELNISDLEGKPLVLNFWAGLCPPCQREMPDFQRFYDAYGDRANVLGVDVGPFTGLGSRQNGRDLLMDLDISYPAGTTLDANVVLEYDVAYMPATYFITADGRIFREWAGGLLDMETLVKVVEELLGQSGDSLGEPRSASGASS